jgi:hypothetical protein
VSWFVHQQHHKTKHHKPASHDAAGHEDDK